VYGPRGGHQDALKQSRTLHSELRDSYQQQSRDIGAGLLALRPQRRADKMSVNLMFHRCTNVRLASTFVRNGNSVQLVITHDGNDTEITLYDLPVELTEKFERFRDKWTHDYKDEEAA
jgi:hypothetical protein